MTKMATNKFKVFFSLVTFGRSERNGKGEKEFQTEFLIEMNIYRNRLELFIR